MLAIPVKMKSLKRKKLDLGKVFLLRYSGNGTRKAISNLNSLLRVTRLRSA
jgi:hypothetical protein